MANNEIRLIIIFVAKDGEAPYSQQKQDWELTVAQIMKSLLSNSDLNWRKQGKPLDHSVGPKSNSLWLYRGSDKYLQGIRSDRGSAWKTMDRSLWHCTGDSDQDYPQEKAMQKGKMIVWRILIKSWEKKRS